MYVTEKIPQNLVHILYAFCSAHLCKTTCRICIFVILLGAKAAMIKSEYLLHSAKTVSSHLTLFDITQELFHLNCSLKNKHNFLFIMLKI